MRKLLSGMVLDLGKCPTRKRMKMKVQVHFPRSKIISESSFPIKSYIITVLNFFWSVLVSIQKSKKIYFPLYFQKQICPMLGVIFTSKR